MFCYWEIIQLTSPNPCCTCLNYNIFLSFICSTNHSVYNNKTPQIYATSDKKVVTFHTEAVALTAVGPTGSHVQIIFCRVHLTGSRCRIWRPGAQNTAHVLTFINHLASLSITPNLVFDVATFASASSLRMAHAGLIQAQKRQQTLGSIVKFSLILPDIASVYNSPLSGLTQSSLQEPVINSRWQ